MQYNMKTFIASGILYANTVVKSGDRDGMELQQNNCGSGRGMSTNQLNVSRLCKYVAKMTNVSNNDGVTSQA